MVVLTFFQIVLTKYVLKKVQAVRLQLSQLQHILSFMKKTIKIHSNHLVEIQR